MRLLAQGRTEALLHLGQGDASGLGLAALQLGKAAGGAASLQFLAPLVVQAAALVDDEEHLEAGVAVQHVRRLLHRGDEVLHAVGDVQRLQQALADPAFAFPLAAVGEKVGGRLGLAHQMVQVVALVHVGSVVGTPPRRCRRQVVAVALGSVPAV
ncbi:hypothetical protein D3C78_1021410 [compost metagenome]